MPYAGLCALIVIRGFAISGSAARSRFGVARWGMWWPCLGHLVLRSSGGATGRHAGTAATPDDDDERAVPYCGNLGAWCSCCMSSRWRPRRPCGMPVIHRAAKVLASRIRRAIRCSSHRPCVCVVACRCPMPGVSISSPPPRAISAALWFLVAGGPCVDGACPESRDVSRRRGGAAGCHLLHGVESECGERESVHRGHARSRGIGVVRFAMARQSSPFTPLDELAAALRVSVCARVHQPSSGFPATSRVRCVRALATRVHAAAVAPADGGGGRHDPGALGLSLSAYSRRASSGHECG